MIIQIDQSLDEPIYLQLRAQIVAGIARGELEPGTQLPSVRALAGDLGINLHTVNKAYAVLRDEGYVIMRGRHGAFISNHPAQAHGQASERLSAALKQLALEHRASGGDRNSFEALAAAALDEAYPERRQS